MCEKRQIVKRFYIVVKTMRPGPPVCVAVFKGNEQVLALRETTKKSVLEELKYPNNNTLFDTVEVDIPVQYLF
jgi:hypothetical protein